MLTLLALACSNTVLVQTGTEACLDWDFDSSEPSYELTETSATEFTVKHTGHVGACGDRFSPEVDASGSEVVIKETWTDGDDADCQTCLVATVTVIDAPDKLVFYWFDDSSAVAPAFTVE